MESEKLEKTRVSVMDTGVVQEVRCNHAVDCCAAMKVRVQVSAVQQPGGTLSTASTTKMPKSKGDPAQGALRKPYRINVLAHQLLLQMLKLSHRNAARKSRSLGCKQIKAKRSQRKRLE